MFIKNYPFKNMVHYSLDKYVVTCEEAASAKGIPLKNELKSLILNTSIGLYLLNIPGDSLANLRSVKMVLNVKEVYLAGENILHKLRVQAGTVTPLLEQIWELPQLLSLEVLKCEFVSTNAGVLDKYIIFSPKILMTHSNIITGHFIK